MQVLAALGTLLYTHLHDMQPIGMYFHQARSYAMLCWARSAALPFARGLAGAPLEAGCR
jgi:hypothetical protein